MAELHKIVGSLLRDIARARVSSDVFSCDVSTQYESNSLLRHFPVPRSEVVEAEMELKFAFGELEDNLKTEEQRNTTLRGLFSTHAMELADNITQEVKPYFRSSEAERGAQLLTDILESYRLALFGGIFNYLNDNMNEIVGEDNVLDVAKTLKVTIQLSEDKLPEGARLDTDYGSHKEAVKELAGDRMKANLNKLANTILFNFESLEGVKLNVEVEANSLQELPKEMLSTVTIKTTLRNYSWSKVGETDDGEVIRRLIPE